MIEPFQPSDLERLFAIEQAAHLVPWTKGTLLNSQGDKYLNLKLSEHNEIIGFAISQIILDEATLFNIAIDPNYQGKGYGKRLLSELILQLKDKGVATLWLEVRESNPARKLYDSLGFNEVDIRKNYYPTPDGGRENAVVMALYL
ncbi:Ribosomal-protein-alanine acetyltransferase [Bibersteinia trehalosi USDA-ARS-USMARC-190]|uniref:[Ribosomal protein bS18]-alanine N-acetyltransferase n=1 Tax=Bibersteinia trehalosi USDA-ARS-USMARC-190 TaxID=1263832 RepID=W0R6T8_BIBTR|nr:ribosomal protein S18-alanine N-acetyltransferase [Bibersteinia trehalosi]AHG86005.1 Ribosomal-protein-alanine acetyltransferase [Bibersteinia trehalosi USDA-ARS-USMARC-190]